MGTIAIIVGMIILLIAAILLWRYIESYENTDDAFVDGHTDPISPRISGFVKAVYVENTYRVKKGQLLLTLDPKDYLMTKEQAVAGLVQAEAGVRAQTPNVPITSTSQSTMVQNAELGVESASASFTAAQEKYRSAVADLHQSEASEANAAREEQRYRLLVVKEEVSREQYDQRETEKKTQQELVASRRETADAAAKGVTQAEAALHQAQQQADEARRNMPRQMEIQNQMLAMKRANEMSAKARADQADLNFGYTQIYAPADGIIGDKSVQVGMQVQPGQELFALTESNDIWVTANFKETQIERMRAGEPVTIHVDALSQDFDGYVEALPGASGAVYSLLPPENATGNYVKVVQRLPVRIRFRNGQRGVERLAPGMSVEPKVWLK
ncbi:MAG TPA: HlyD family secretion protein [Acidobacteriaceae bacterium]|nr:HlyD family secretion protein [Acidobacteriaceae bacterium]